MDCIERVEYKAELRIAMEGNLQLMVRHQRLLQLNLPNIY